MICINDHFLQKCSWSFVAGSTLAAADLSEAGSWLTKQGGTITVDRIFSGSERQSAI